MITKLAPQKLVSVVMGLWMASFAAGNYLAGMLESILHKYDFPVISFYNYVNVRFRTLSYYIVSFLKQSNERYSLKCQKFIK